MMSAIDFMQLGVFLVLLLGLSWPLGKHIAAVLEGRRHPLARALGWLERGLYRLCGVDPAREMDWKGYALAMFLFNVAGFAALYLLLRLQGWLPLNPDGQAGMEPGLAFNTAMSFATNTNWQAYGGESAISHLTQMLGLTVHNFVSAATGIAVLAALIRGLTRRETRELGNFWADLVRSTLYILLPLAFVLALALNWQGVPQTFAGAVNATLAEPVAYEIAPSADELKADPTLKPTPATATQQTIMRGPMASQEAIKELGTNGGGFFNANSAHPFENPTPLTNLLEMLAILLIPASLCHAFGRMVGDARQGWVLFCAMGALFLGFFALCWWAEAQGVPQVAAITGGGFPGNMEGKELRFGIMNSALFATITTATSCGAVNAMHDSFTPLGGLVPMVLMQLGEVVFGGFGGGYGGGFFDQMLGSMGPMLAAGGSGLGLAFVLVLILPGLIAIQGMCQIYISAIAGLDLVSAKKKLEGGLTQVKDRVKEAQRGAQAAAESARASSQQQYQQQSQPTFQAPAANACAICGEPLNPGDKFCGGCGNKTQG